MIVQSAAASYRHDDNRKTHLCEVTFHGFSNRGSNLPGFTS